MPNDEWCHRPGTNGAFDLVISFLWVVLAPVSDAPVTLNPALAAVPAPAAAAVPAARAGRRLAWLDALRGIAALFVVFDHLGYYVLQHARVVVYQWFDPGLYGVFVFFMVSGYIVPASLERKGSVRGFWVSRVFRLYPLYIFAL